MKPLYLSIFTAFQGKQKGSIGIAINAVWYEPFSNSSQDRLAAERAQSFYMNWWAYNSNFTSFIIRMTPVNLFCRFLDPIIFGKYPEEMKDILGSSLPEFSNDYLKNLNNGLDFIGINHYTSFYAKDCLHSICEQGPGISKTEGRYLRTALKNNISIGESVCNSKHNPDDLFVYKRVQIGTSLNFLFCRLCRLQWNGLTFILKEWRR